MEQNEEENSTVCRLSMGVKCWLHLRGPAGSPFAALITLCKTGTSSATNCYCIPPQYCLVLFFFIKKPWTVKLLFEPQMSIRDTLSFVFILCSSLPMAYYEFDCKFLLSYFKSFHLKKQTSFNASPIVTKLTSQVLCIEIVRFVFMVSAKTSFLD